MMEFWRGTTQNHTQPHVLEMLPEANCWNRLYLGSDTDPKTTLRDLFAVLTNFRALVRAAQALRLKDEKNRSEWESLHATMTQARRQIKRQFILAIVEGLTRPDDEKSRVCACAVVDSYALQCSLLLELMDLAGDQRWKLLERYMQGPESPAYALRQRTGGLAEG